MNYLRQLSSKDRETSRTNLKSKFDFDDWLAAVESSSSRRRSVSREVTSPATIPEEEQHPGRGTYGSPGWTEPSATRAPHSAYFSTSKSGSVLPFLAD